MRRLRGNFLRLAGLFAKERREQDLSDELASHLEMHIEDHLRPGMTAEEARLAQHPIPRLETAPNAVPALRRK